MRALYLVLLVVICLPLQAGERPELERAVDMFKSNDVATRAAGTKVADKELRRLLAPFLEALKDPDPEVRRRVRESILALVPYHDREAETAQERANRFQKAQLQALQLIGRKGVVIRGARLQIQPAQQQVLQALVRAQLLNPNNANAVKGQRLVAKLGLTGRWIQMGKRRGYQVTAVTKASTAERSGLRVGDIVIGINKVDFTNYDVFLKALDPRRGWSGAKFQILRRGNPAEVTLK